MLIIMLACLSVLSCGSSQTLGDTKIETSADKSDNRQELVSGKQVTLSCITEPVNADNKLTTWLKNEIEEVKPDKHIRFDDAKNLIIDNAYRSLHEGNYTCVFKFGERATIRLRAKPLVWEIMALGFKRDGNSVNIIDGERLVLNCTVATIEPVSIQWFVGEEVDEMKEVDLNDRRNLTFTSNSSSLVIHSVERDDRAYYKCIADNGIDNSSSIILVRVKDKLAALWPFLGIVGEVIILCTIICLYEKSRRKPDFTESETEASNEGKSSSAQARAKNTREDARQRK